LSLAVAPTFAIMALLTGALGPSDYALLGHATSVDWLTGPTGQDDIRQSHPPFLGTEHGSFSSTALCASAPPQAAGAQLQTQRIHKSSATRSILTALHLAIGPFSYLAVYAVGWITAGIEAIPSQNSNGIRKGHGKPRRKSESSGDGPGNQGCAMPYRELNASSCRDVKSLEIDMKTIVSALIALSVLAGIAAPVSAKPQCPGKGEWPYCRPPAM
jgi:hypothetical protein